MAAKYVDKTYLIDQFKNYDRDVASAKYGNTTTTLVNLNDVVVNNQTLTDGDGIKWDATTSKWVNGAVASAELTYEETMAILNGLSV